MDQKKKTAGWVGKEQSREYLGLLPSAKAAPLPDHIRTL